MRATSSWSVMIASINISGEKNPKKLAETRDTPGRPIWCNTRCAVRNSGSNADLVFHGVARDRIWLTGEAEEGEDQPGKRVFDGFKQTFVYKLTVPSNFSLTQALLRAATQMSVSLTR